MDPKTQKTYEALKEIRKKESIQLPISEKVRKKIKTYRGEEDLSLRNYQTIGILHLILMARFVLGDDCGLGKTIQTVVALCKIWDKDPDHKAIIVTNKSLVGQWETEFQKFTEDGEVQVFVCYGTPAKRQKVYKRFEEATGPCVLVLGYASVRQDFFDHLTEFRGFTLVFDECTNVKTPSARLSQICRVFSTQASRCWGLTATLIKRDLRDGWGIYAVVFPGLFEEKTEESFSRRFCQTREVDAFFKHGKMVKKRIITGSSEAQTNDFIKVIEPYFLSRSREVIGAELPTLTIKLIELEMNSAQRDKYDEALNGMLVLGSGEEKETTKLSRLAYCQQIANHLELLECEGESPKLDALLDLLSQGDLADQKVVVFSRFKSMIDIIERELKKANVASVRLTGDENEKQREEAKKIYSDVESGVNVCLITDAAKEGANLQVSKAIIFFDTPWTGGDFIQILGRMIRIGSLHPTVYALHLVMKRSIDERTIEKLMGSMDVIEKVVGERIRTEEGANGLKDRTSSLNSLFDSLFQDRSHK